MQDEQRQEGERPIPESEWPYEGDERDDWPKPDAPASVDKASKKDDASPVRHLWRASMIGIHIVTSTFVGLALGYWLDRLFGSEPWLTIIFLLIGIAAGFRDLFRFAWDNDKPFTPKKSGSEGEGGNGKD